MSTGTLAVLNCELKLPNPVCCIELTLNAEQRHPSVSSYDKSFSIRMSLAGTKRVTTTASMQHKSTIQRPECPGAGRLSAGGKYG